MTPDWIIFAWLFGSIVTPLLVVGGILWLRRSFVTGAELRSVGRSLDVERNRINAANEQFDHLRERVTSTERKVEAIERHNGEPPSRGELSKDIGKLAERLRGVEVGMDNLKRTGETTNDYLQALIEQGLRK